MTDSNNSNTKGLFNFFKLVNGKNTKNIVRHRKGSTGPYDGMWITLLYLLKFKRKFSFEMQGVLWKLIYFIF